MFDDESQVPAHSFRVGERWTGENPLKLLSDPDRWRRGHKGDDSLLQVRNQSSLSVDCKIYEISTLINFRLGPGLRLGESDKRALSLTSRLRMRRLILSCGFMPAAGICLLRSDKG